MYGWHTPSDRPCQLPKPASRVRRIGRADVAVVVGLGFDRVAEGVESHRVLGEGVVVPVGLFDRLREILVATHPPRVEPIHPILEPEAQAAGVHVRDISDVSRQCHSRLGSSPWILSCAPAVAKKAAMSPATS